MRDADPRPTGARALWGRAVTVAGCVCVALGLSIAPAAAEAAQSTPQATPFAAATPAPAPGDLAANDPGTDGSLDQTDDAQGLFHPQKAVLDNGLEIYVVTNDRQPVVAQYIWYRVGGADEPPGQSGIAHLLEHLMFKGTPNFPDGVFSDKVTEVGGNDNAMTSWDFTVYFQKVHKDHLPMIMEMEADRMVNLILSEEQVLTERDVVLEERRQRTDNNPANQFWEQVDSVLYRSHPYSVPIIGWEQEIAQLTREDALAFYNLHYAPNNAAVFIVGDVTMDEVLPLARQYYGAIPARRVPPREWPLVPALGVDIRVERADPRVQQAQWMRRWLAPTQATEADLPAEKHHAAALQVLSSILGDGATSRLYRRLVVEDQLASAVSAFYRPSARAKAAFGVYAVPLPGVESETLEQAVAQEITRLVEQGVTEAELTRARRQLKAQAVFAQDSFATPAYYLGMAWAVGLDVAEADRWLWHVQRVTGEQVVAAAEAVLVDQNSVVAWLTPATAVATAEPAPVDAPAAPVQ